MSAGAKAFNRSNPNAASSRPAPVPRRQTTALSAKNCRTMCRFAAPGRRAEQEHDRHVDARDDQDRCRRGHEQPERRTHVPELHLAERRQPDAPAFIRGVGLRQLSLQLPGHAVEIGLRLGKGYAWSETRQQEERTIAAVGCTLRREIERLPDRGAPLRIGEPGGHDADDGVLHAVDPYGAADHLRRAAQVPLPEVVTDQHDAVIARPLLGLRDVTAERRLHAEERQQVRRRPDHLHALGAVLEAQRGAAANRRRDTGEAPLPGAIVEQLGLRYKSPVARVTAQDVAHFDQPFGVWIGRALEDHAVEDAEEGRVRPHAQGEREHRHEGEAGRLGQLAKGELELCDHG